MSINTDIYKYTTEPIQKIICAPILAYFLLTTICVFGREIIGDVGFPRIVFPIIRFGIPAILFIRAFRYLSKRSFFYFFWMEVIFIFSYTFAYTQGYMVTDRILDYVVLTCVTCVPCCVLAMNIKDSEYFIDRLVSISYLSSAILIIYLIATVSTVRYSMSSTYLLLLFLLVHLNEIVRNKTKNRWLFIAWVTLEFFLIFLRGARGPLACIGVYIMIKAISDVRNNKKLVYGLFAGAILLIIMAMNIELIISLMSSIFESYDLSSRNLMILQNAAFLEDSGRGYYRNLALEYINERPFIGYGASSDIYLISAYPHNMLVEMWFDFGVVFGTVFFIFFIIALFKILECRDKYLRDAGIIFVVTGFVMLMVSGTYLQSPNVFIMLGIGLNKFFSNKLRIKYKLRQKPDVL